MKRIKSSQKNKRRLTALTALLSLILLLMVSLTIAYFTDQRLVLNILGIGTGGTGGTASVKITLTEPGFASTANIVKTTMNPGESGEYSKLELYNILPGQKINKDPTITNIGTENVYVRFKLTRKVPDGGSGFNDIAVDITEEPYATLGVTVDPDIWTLKGDGYYYLKEVLPTTSSSNIVAVFKNLAASGDPYTMSVPADISNNHASGIVGTLMLEVKAEAIQSTGFTQNLTAENPWTDENSDPVTIIPAIRG